MDPDEVITYEMLFEEKPSDKQLKGMIFLLDGDPAGMTREQMENWLVRKTHEEAGLEVPPRPTEGAKTYDFVDTEWPDWVDRGVAKLPEKVANVIYDFMETLTPKEAAALVIVLLAVRRWIFDREGPKSGSKPRRNTERKPASKGGNLFDNLKKFAEDSGWKL